MTEKKRLETGKKKGWKPEKEKKRLETCKYVIATDVSLRQCKTDDKVNRVFLTANVFI